MPDDAALTEPQCKRVQIALAGPGYHDGCLDGVFGPDTRAAIRRWQHEKGADRTGRLTGAQVTELVADQHEEECSFLKKRTKRLLLLRSSHDLGHGLDLSVGTRSKSLLVLFFRKEHLTRPFNRALTTGDRLG
jgi:peptidoglycan hydrolase-like protein with peptidoglycan-binding domain